MFFWKAIYELSDFHEHLNEIQIALYFPYEQFPVSVQCLSIPIRMPSTGIKVLQFRISSLNCRIWRFFIQNKPGSDEKYNWS
jgi:hypothetical protein